MSNTNTNSIIPSVGVPPFKGVVKRVRASGYDFFKAFGDLIDNAVCRSENIIITLIEDPETKLLNCIYISDDCEKGFENITKNGSDNPFNLAHIRVGHNNDDETSEFGTGIKTAAVSCGNLFKVVTRVDNEDGIHYWCIEMDFSRNDE